LPPRRAEGGFINQQHLDRDGLVNALASDGQATLQAQLHVRLFAPVDGSG
jgi:hypothetical protein